MSNAAATIVRAAIREDYGPIKVQRCKKWGTRKEREDTSESTRTESHSTLETTGRYGQIQSVDKSEDNSAIRELEKRNHRWKSLQIGHIR